MCAHFKMSGPLDDNSLYVRTIFIPLDFYHKGVNTIYNLLNGRQIVYVYVNATMKFFNL